MEQEFLRKTRRSVTLNVTGGKIDSFRQLERTTGTVRVYENGLIGVAGCLGEPDKAALTEQAKQALGFGIPYPCRLDGPFVLEELHDEEILPIPALIPTMQAFFDRLGECCPRFAFSNKIALEYGRSEYENSRGRLLVSAGRSVSVGLVAQSRGSGNLYDTVFEWEGDRFEPEVLLRQFRKEHDAFYRPARLEPGRWPVILESNRLLRPFLRHFVGDLYAAGASLLSGKLSQPVFSEQLSFRIDKNPATACGLPFFDAEGVTAPDFRPTLVENGVLTGLLATKKSAQLYGLPVPGTAAADYDGVPELGYGVGNFRPDATAGSLRDLVPGKAVYVVVTSGGDVTPDGHFAAPAQMAYLMENGELVGRLPDLTLGGSFFDLLGRDYLGTVHDDPLPGSLLSAAVMDVSVS